MSDPILKTPTAPSLIAFAAAFRIFSPVFVASRIRRPIHVGTGNSATYQETGEGIYATPMLTPGVPDES
ncbi:hypothetical protein BD311DRAFT_616942, partial [Dichomitus squalens]